MCFSVTFPDTEENCTKFLYSTRKGRDLFAFTVSNLDKVELSKVRFISTSDEKCSQHSTKEIRMTNKVRFYFLKFLFHLSRSFVLIKNLSGTAVKKRNSVD